MQVAPLITQLADQSLYLLDFVGVVGGLSVDTQLELCLGFLPHRLVSILSFVGSRGSFDFQLQSMHIVIEALDTGESYFESTRDCSGGENNLG